MAERSSKSKYFYTGCGVIIILIIAGILGMVILLYAGPGVMEINEYHPFKSERAQEKYLALYDERAKLYPVASETRMVETSYGFTFARISGPEGAPPLVLLHGMGGNSLQWMPNVEDLSQEYRVIAIDTIYDHGRSIYTRESSGPGDMVVWLDETFTGLELGNSIDLVGLSYGGWLTSQYALYYPERLNKIVLIAPAATVLPIDAEWIGRAAWTVLPHPFFARNFMSWLLEDFYNQDQASRYFLEEQAYETTVAIRSFKPVVPVNPYVLTNSELQQILVPTLFLIGENEKIYSAQEALERLHTVVPKFETAVIPNAGHDLTIVQPDLVNQKILEFLGTP